MKKLFILFLICFLSSAVWADDPEKTRVFPENQPMTFRGLDDSSSPVFVENGRARSLQNVKFTSAGGLSKRKGYSLIDETLDQLDTDFPAITGLYDAQYSDGKNYPIATIGDEIYYNDGNSWEDVSGVYTITAGKNNQFVFLTANDYVIGTNDVDVPLKIDSSLAATTLDLSDLSDTVTKVKCLAWVRNHLILANTVENSVERPTRIRWSNIGYIETFSDDDYIDIASLSGEEINAVKELYGDLYIFLDKSIWKISYVGGDEVYVLSKVIDGIGCVAKNSVQNVILPNNQRGLIFLDRSKIIYLFNGITVISMSDWIEGTLDGLSDTRLKYAVSIEDGNSYYLAASLSGYTENNILLEFDYTIGEWTKHTQIDANAFARIEESTNIIKTYFGNYDAMVYWLDNEDLLSDVDGCIGTVDSVFTSTETRHTATGLQMIVDTSLGATTSGLIGAIIKITGGTAAGEEQIIADNVATGVFVTTAFTTTPDSTSSYSIGAIEAEYTTKWYDLGDPARNKSFRYMYLWGEEQTNVSHNLTYYSDFGSAIDTNVVSMHGGADALWGVAVWGVDTWGTVDDLFKREVLSGEGRYISFKFQENDIDEDMYIYGWNVIYDVLDVE